MVRPLIFGSGRPIGFKGRLRAGSRSIAVGADDFAAGAGTQCHPGLKIDRVLDEPDAAIAQRHVHPSRMLAIGIAEIRPGARADATAVREGVVVEVGRCDRDEQTYRHCRVRPVIAAVQVGAPTSTTGPYCMASLTRRLP